jgi:hypothetical protein
MAKASDFVQSNEDVVINDLFNFAAAEIYRQYGHRVAINRKSLQKFGRDEGVGTNRVEISPLNQNEAYLSDNLITHVSSDSTLDTQEIYYEGMTIDSSGFTFISDIVTLNGQNKTALPTPVARHTRAINANSTDLDGDVYFYQDVAVTAGVPDDLTKAHNIIIASDNTTLKAGTTIAKNNYFLASGVSARVFKKTQGQVDIRLRVRDFGGVFITKLEGSCTQSLALREVFEPFMIVKPNSDIFLTATATTSGVAVGGVIYGVFADIIG